MVRRTMCAAALTAAVAFGGQALGQADTAGQPQRSGQQQSQQSADLTPDKLFIKHAAVGNMFEQQLAQLAQQKGQSEEVKQIAQKLQQDHGKALQQSKQVAQQLDVDVPQQLPEEKQEMLQCFRSLSGEEFDRHYLSHLKAMHAKDVSAYGDVAKMAENEQVKQYAQQQLPALRQHSQQVVAAAGDMGMGGEQAQPAGARMGAEDKPDSDRPGQGRTAPGSSSDEHGIPGNQPLPNAGGSRSGTDGSNRGPTERQ